MTKTEQSVKALNYQLRQTLGLARDINRNRLRPTVRIERHLEDELKRRKLTSNEPE